jgi:hypothetical protein
MLTLLTISVCAGDLHHGMRSAVLQQPVQLDVFTNTPCWHLSPSLYSQVTFIMACAELYFSSLCSLMQERKALHEALVTADGQLSECQRRLLGIDGGVDQMALLDRLSSNLKKEHVLRIMLNCFVWGRILTAVQFAKTAGEAGRILSTTVGLVCDQIRPRW